MLFQDLETRFDSKYMNSDRDKMCIYCALKIGARLNKKKIK